MDEAKKYTLGEADLQFAKVLNGKVWELLQKPDRSKLEDEQMIHAAHASCYHWLSAGTNLHYQRAEWLIAHVYAELGLAASALYHAYRCLELTNQYPELMKDFDRAYAYEAVARANALAGNQDEALQYLQLAEASGRAIQNEEDKNIFLSDFNAGDWHGLKIRVKGEIMQLRNAQPADYLPIVTVINDWWGGRLMRDKLPKLFFVHFRETSFIVEEDDRIVGFLIGFLSQTFPDEAYIHFVGVHPDYRKNGIGKILYEHFFETVRGYGRRVVRCVTAPINTGSIAFHTCMGFQIETEEVRGDGAAYTKDYDGVGEHRVEFVKYL